MADAESPPWAELVPDIVREIGRHLLCEIDRHHADGLCRSWRDALLQLRPPPPPLPRLVLPEADGPAFYCVPSGCRPPPFVLPPAELRARCFGSYDGAWIFQAVDQAANHVLLNLITHQQLNLPNLIRFPSFLLPGLTFDFEVAFVAATLSSQPTDQGCVGASIIGFKRRPLNPRHIAFWRMGDEAFSQSIESRWIDEELELDVVDLLYSGHGAGAFLFLTNGEHIREFPQPIFPPPGTAKRVRNELYFKPRGDDGGGGRPVLARYLVESRDELLMVVRLGTRKSCTDGPRRGRWQSPPPPPPPTPTSAFQVFQREDQKVKSINDIDGVVRVEHSWIKLADLGGRMLFVGRGCSRS
jgi:hypothetical protein